MNGPIQIPQVPAIPAPPSAPRPNILQQILEAASQYPQMKQQAETQQLQQSQVRNQAFSDQLAQIHDLVSSRPEMASDQRVLATVANIFKMRGLPPPIAADPQSGQSKVDINALGIETPAQKALQNPEFTQWFMKLPPENRKAISESSGLHFSDDVVNAPQFNAPSAGEITAAVKEFANLPQQIATGQATLDGAISTIQGLYPILKSSGVDPAAMIASLKPTLTAKLQAEIAQKVASGHLSEANAATVMGTLTAKIRKANSDADFAAIHADIAKIDDQFRAASDSAKIKKDEADATRALADANRSNAQAEHAHQQAQQILTGHGASHLSTVLNTLQRDHHQQALAVQHLRGTSEFYRSQLINETDDGKKAQIQARIKELDAQAAAAQTRADKSKAQYEALQHTAVSKELQGGEPADMRPGTVEFFQSLDPQKKQAYLANPKVPQDVRDYLAAMSL